MRHIQTPSEFIAEGYDSYWDAGIVVVNGVKIPVTIRAWRDNPDIGINAAIDMSDEETIAACLKAGIWSGGAFDDEHIAGFAWANKTVDPDKVGYDAESMSDSDVYDYIGNKIEPKIKRAYTAKQFIAILNKGDYDDWAIVGPEKATEVKKLMANKALMEKVGKIAKPDLIKLARGKEVSAEAEAVIKEYMRLNKSGRPEAVDAILLVHEHEGTN